MRRAETRGAVRRALLSGEVRAGKREVGAPQREHRVPGEQRPSRGGRRERDVPGLRVVPSAPGHDAASCEPRAQDRAPSLGFRAQRAALDVPDAAPPILPQKCENPAVPREDAKGEREGRRIPGKTVERLPAGEGVPAEEVAGGIAGEDTGGSGGLGPGTRLGQ